jgi:hypothetical protein
MLTLAAAFLAIALAYFTKVQNYSLCTSWPSLASIIVFILAFAGFYLAIRETPFPPWAKTGFPDIHVEIHGGMDFPMASRTLPNGMVVRAPVFGYKVRITNREREQNANLTVTLFRKLEPGSAGRIGETIDTALDWPLDPTLSANVIKMPIALAPGATIGGDLLFDLSSLMGGKLADPERSRLELTDHVSNQRRNIIMEAAIGRFGRDDMKPSKGGVRILGPEYETKPDESGNDRKASPPEQPPSSS